MPLVSRAGCKTELCLYLHEATAQLYLLLVIGHAVFFRFNLATNQWCATGAECAFIELTAFANVVLLV
jgi:hypothetical protein